MALTITDFVEEEDSLTIDDIPPEIQNRINDTLADLTGDPPASGPTEGSPTGIGDWNDLDAVRDNPSATYTLLNDLDSSTAGYDSVVDPDADGFDPIENFAGVFDGQDHEIADLRLQVNESDEQRGLFESTTTNSEIRNLTLTAISTGGTEPNADFVGALVGTNDGTVSNVAVTGDVTAQDDVPVGGVVGKNNGTISNSEANVTVESGKLSSVGGIVAINSGTIENSEVEGEILADQASPEDSLGGTSVGGFVGTNNGIIKNAHTESDVTSNIIESRIGGLVGTNNGEVTGSNAEGTVDGGQGANTGGLVGLNDGTSATIKESFATGKVGNGDDNTNAGGLVGNNLDGGSIVESFAAGDVTGGSEAQAGGLVGANQYAEADSNTVTSSIKQSYATGDVNSKQGDFIPGKAGGLVGANYGNIEKSYATGSVSTESGDVEGGIVGNQSDGSLTDSYWDSQETGQTSGASFLFGGTGGTVNNIKGLTTSQMTGNDAQTYMSSFDLTDTWDTVSGDYPILQSIDEEVQ
ncbi:GLUG motif-containing protein [Halorubrum ezzemoulense]|uniref:GLUG motif-containing protein n=1 Tax=Halorubrum ezzemoulense TaxID=337243 RepID=UPI00117A96E1|nr:GLUG motif-containing protein [Halorubrum ezzemoulense]